MYGRYNATGAAAGALGSLAVTLPGLGPHGGPGGVHAWLFLVLVPVGITGVVLASRLSAAVEARPDKASALGGVTGARTRLGPSRDVVRRLAGLFAVDAAGGGLVTTEFLSYYFAERYHVSVAGLGWLLFAVSVVQAVSVALAPLPARRFGLVATMVGTHLPSNLLLAAVAFASTFGMAAVLPPSGASAAMLNQHGEEEAPGSCAALLDAARRPLMKKALKPARPRPGLILANCPFGTLLGAISRSVCGMNLAIMDGFLRRLGRFQLTVLPDPARDDAACASLPLTCGTAVMRGE